MQPLALLSVKMLDWFQRSMELNTEAHGWPALSSAQGVLVGHVANGEHRAARLAKKLGVSRQAVHILIRQLVELGIVEATPDPDDRRAVLVTMADAHTEFADFLRATMTALEARLAARIGVKQVEQLRVALSADWGEYPMV